MEDKDKELAEQGVIVPVPGKKWNKNWTYQPVYLQEEEKKRRSKF